MKSTIIIKKYKNIPKKLNNPTLIIGLPGIGLVGQILIKYLIKNLNAKNIADLISPHFPHQVLMTKSGLIKLIKNRFYLARTKNLDLIFLTGDVQALTSEGQYEVASKIISFASSLGVKRIIAIGGYSTGKLNENRRVFAVATSKDLVEKCREAGSIIGEAKGGIVGAAGLIPGLARLKKIDGICLMGETHGNYIDVSAASSVATVLQKILGVEFDLEELRREAEEKEKIIRKIEEEVKRQLTQPFKDEERKDISYIR